MRMEAPVPKPTFYLIERPVLVKGRKAVFGFDKDALEAALGAHGR
jgi:arsenate reductase-like glutaredoxin family protein